MSKKTISFTLPTSRMHNGNSDGVEATAEAPETPATEPEAWVLSGNSEDSNLGYKKHYDGVLIDLTARRDWFELMQLIWSFPFLATWYWTAGYLENTKRQAQ